jgi:chitin disaccharide deacetylase
MDARRLIVNADDFGLSLGVNRGIITAYEQGIVTSASLMVRYPAAAEAAGYGREHPDLSLGLHVDLGEWTYRDGDWVPLYQVVSVQDSAEVADEVSRQLAIFRRLVGKNPTHIDSHQHVHLRESVRPIAVKIASDLAIPLRNCNSKIRYCGDFYGQTAEGLPFHSAISVNALIEILTMLPSGPTELACHPGEDDALETMYHSERIEEVMALCDPRVREAVSTRNIELCSFSDAASSANPAFWDHS